jgi:hypothetical protein
MKYIISILALVLTLNVFSQNQIPDSCFTKKQVLDISFTIDSLWYLDSINKLIIEQQSSIISDYDLQTELCNTNLKYKNDYISMLQSTITAYEDERTKYYKWYNRKSVWVGIGVIATTVVFKIVAGF